MTRAPIDWLPLLRDALAAEGRFRLPLRGDSMTPTLPVECEIDVIPLPGEPRPGALLVFALGDGLVAHRFIRRRGDTLIALGDHRRAPDPPLRREQVLGEVAAAWVGERRAWPRRGERMWRAWWVARGWGWLGMRRMTRFHP